MRRQRRGTPRADLPERVVTLRVMQVIGWLSVAAVLLQAFLAGAFMDGEENLVHVHEVLGMALVFPLLAALLITTIVHRWKDRGPSWPIGYAVAAIALTALQINLGYRLVFAWHIPLGIALLGIAVWIAKWAGDRAARSAGPGTARGTAQGLGERQPS